VGCRATVAQATLVRIAIDEGRLVIDAQRRLPGRGAYVHPRAACVTPPGLARSLRRTVTPSDVQRLLAAMSRADDNSQGHGSDQRSDLLAENAPGLGDADAVETPSLAGIKAEDDRSEDARL